MDLYKRLSKNFLNSEMIDPMIDKKKYESVVKKDIRKFQVVLLCVNHKNFKYKKLIENLDKNSTIFDLCFYFKQNKINPIFKKENIKIHQIGKYDE